MDASLPNSESLCVADSSPTFATRWTGPDTTGMSKPGGADIKNCSFTPGAAGDAVGKLADFGGVEGTVSICVTCTGAPVCRARAGFCVGVFACDGRGDAWGIKAGCASRDGGTTEHGQHSSEGTGFESRRLQKQR